MVRKRRRAIELVILAILVLFPAGCGLRVDRVPQLAIELSSAKAFVGETVRATVILSYSWPDQVKAQGEPIKDIDITLEQIPQGIVLRGKTDETGRCNFFIRGEKPGEQTLLARAPSLGLKAEASLMWLPPP